MSHVRISVLGPAQVTVEGEEVPLAPTTVRLLLRLVAAEGEPIGVSRLRQDVWGVTDQRGYPAQRGRNEVQKRIGQLRAALPAGLAAAVLRTESIALGLGQETAYRLVLDAGLLDSIRFTDLVRQGLQAPPAIAADLLTEAIGLWRGVPLADAGEADYARAAVGRLRRVHATARTELVDVLVALGRHSVALPIAEQLAEEAPGDEAAARRLAEIRAGLRERRGRELWCRELPEHRARVTVVRGDLFDEADASLVVGFADTFDIATAEDFVISRSSVQGQLIDRLFGGDGKALDRKLANGLRAVPLASVESPQDKRRGKRRRYPVGTVVPISVAGQRVFATAYSRLDNKLVARSDPASLRLSLDRLWESVELHGQYRPVAMPLVGSGLARVSELDRRELLDLISDSFAAACRRLESVSPELRIVIPPGDVEKLGLGAAR